MSRFTKLKSERGAILIQTGLAAFVLIGFSTFVVDYGVLWVARHQAQNAADAGAMAGAIARAYEDFDDPPDPTVGVAGIYAKNVADANLVWGASAAVGVTFDGVCPPGVGASNRCVRVDVYRDTDHANPLPAFFAPVLGLPGTQGVRATARAQVMVGNTTNCLRPWAIPDKWVEGGAAGPDYKKWDASGAILAAHDDYTPPSAVGPGTGFRFATSNAAFGDLGAPVVVTRYTALADPLIPGWLVPLDLPGGYAASVASCNGQPIGVGDQFRISDATPPSEFDFLDLFDEDSGASWNAGIRAIQDTCAPACGSVSPRLVAVAVFDVDLFQYRRATGNWNACPPVGGSPSCTPCGGGLPCVTIVNVVGLFIGDAAGSSGYLTSYPGVVPTEAPKLTAASSFLKAISLVR